MKAFAVISSDMLFEEVVRGQKVSVYLLES